MKFYLKTKSVSRYDRGFFNKSKKHIVQMVCISIVSENGYSYTAISKDYYGTVEGHIDHYIGDLDKNLHLLLKYESQIAKEINDFVLFHAFNENIEWFGYDGATDLVILQGLSQFGYAHILPEFFTDLRQTLIEIGREVVLNSSYILAHPYAIAPEPGSKVDSKLIYKVMCSHQDFPADPGHNITDEAFRVAKIYKFIKDLRDEILLTEVKE